MHHLNDYFLTVQWISCHIIIIDLLCHKAANITQIWTHDDQ